MKVNNDIIQESILITVCLWFNVFFEDEICLIFQRFHSIDMIKQFTNGFVPKNAKKPETQESIQPVTDNNFRLTYTYLGRPNNEKEKLRIQLQNNSKWVRQDKISQMNYWFYPFLFHWLNLYKDFFMVIKGNVADL